VSDVNLYDVETEAVAGRPTGYEMSRARVGELLGASALGLSVYDLPPGQSAFPYHYELGREEWLLVLSGRPTLRDPDGEHALEPWDIVFFPKRPEGAHLLRNDGEDTVRVLMFSDLVHPTATVYPDSDKVAIWTGDDAVDVIVRRSSAAGYYDGEA
jgi:uncharacterized cupin superfamily protein